MSNAQTTPQYRIYELGLIPGAPVDTGSSRAFALNNLGEIVGQSTSATPAAETRAFVWLFLTHYGITTAKQMMDLTSLAGPQSVSVAYDINNLGQVAGQIGSTLHGAAAVWNLAGTSGFEFCNLGSFVSSFAASATAINDGIPAMQIPPKVVGNSLSISLCFPPVNRAFRITFTGGCPQLSEGLHALVGLPGEFGDDPGTQAFDISNDSSLSAALVVGDSGLCAAGIGMDCVLATIARGAWWRGVARGQLVPPTTFVFQGVDVNNLDPPNIVGWGFDGAVPCLNQARFWPNVDRNPFNLGGLLPPPLESRANAINNPDVTGLRSVVGATEFPQRAWSWQGQGTQWTATDLNTTLLDTIPDPLIVWPCGWEKLTSATDVNDKGMIVGWGDRDTSTTVLRERAFLLVPLSKCLSDLNADCVVDSADLGIFLVNFGGTCPVGGCVRCNFNATGPCLADLNCDGVVNSIDLGILLNSWTLPPATVCGPECESSGSMMAGGGGGASPSSMTVLSSGELATPSFDECIDLLILLGQDDFAQFLMDLVQSPQ